MMRFFAAATFSILVALALAASLFAKGATTKITVSDLPSRNQSTDRRRSPCEVSGVGRTGCISWSRAD
jgi:hypothetical protein